MKQIEELPPRRRRGRPSGLVYAERLTVTVTKKQKKIIEQHAGLNGITISALIRSYLFDNRAK